MLKRMSCALLAVLSLDGCSIWTTRAVPVTSAADVLVDRARGFTLYTYDRDVVHSGESRCQDACSRDWPPVIAAGTARAAGNYSIIARPDGVRQWVYRGRPLYRSVRDQAPGDQRGDGVESLWRVARP